MSEVQISVRYWPRRGTLILMPQIDGDQLVICLPKPLHGAAEYWEMLDELDKRGYPQARAALEAFRARHEVRK